MAARILVAHSASGVLVGSTPARSSCRCPSPKCSRGAWFRSPGLPLDDETQPPAASDSDSDHTPPDLHPALHLAPGGVARHLQLHAAISAVPRRPVTASIARAPQPPHVDSHATAAAPTFLSGRPSGDVFPRCGGSRMRVVLADIKGGEGFIGKDTVAGGYGSRLRPFSRVTRVISFLKRRFHDVPSVHLAYLAALAAEAGSRGALHTRRTRRGRRRTGAVVDCRFPARVGVCRRDAGARRARRASSAWLRRRCPSSSGITPTSFSRASPKRRSIRLLAGEILDGIVDSPQIDDLDTLALPEMGSCRRSRGRRLDIPYWAGRRAADSRCWPAAAARSICDVLPAPDSGRLPLEIGRSHPRRDRSAGGADTTSTVCDLSRSPLQPGS